MLFGKPGEPTKLKRKVYLCASTILGMLLSFIAHGLIEINYLRQAESQGKIVPFYGSCTLMPILQIALLVFGALGGFFLGRFWWRKLYIERVWDKK